MLCSWRKAQQSLGVAMSQVSGPVQFSSFAQSCLTLWDSMDCNTPGFPVHHKLPRVSWNSCLLSRWCHLTISSSVSPSPPALNLSQHQGLFQWVSSFFFFFFQWVRSSLVQWVPFLPGVRRGPWSLRVPAAFSLGWKQFLGSAPWTHTYSLTDSKAQILSPRSISSHSWRFVSPVLMYRWL